MSHKHFFSDPSSLVTSSLFSCTLSNPALALDKQNKILYRRPGHSPQVSIVSGGGSGHEPSFAGYVGVGMLSATVAGTIFASPSTRQITSALRARVDPSKGILVIILNYTGDVLHFGMAVEQAKAAGLKVELVVVGDDAGVGREQTGKVGRRGLAGCVLVHKLAGALATSGGSLEQVSSLARLVSENVITVGASLSHVHVPGHGPMDPSTILKENEVEIGMGVHSEPGCERATLELPELVAKMLTQLLSQEDKDRSFLRVNSNEVVLMVNNLGGLSNLELGGITTEVVSQLASKWSIQPVRVLSGTYMTSLNGVGFSITLLNVVNTNLGGPSMLQLLDVPAECTGWAANVQKETWESRNQAVFDAEVPTTQHTSRSDLLLDVDDANSRLKRGLEAVIAAEPQITAFDTVVGDGDCGVGMKRGSQALLDVLADPLPGLALDYLNTLTSVVAEAMDGTSGAIISIFLSAVSTSLLSLPTKQEPSVILAREWIDALSNALVVLRNYTPARVGDRTLIDAVAPFIQSLKDTGDLKVAAESATTGAKETKGMKPGLGRSVYVGGDGYMKVPDPGAWGVAQFLHAFAGLEDHATTDGDFELV